MDNPNAPARPADSRVRDHLANERTFLAWIRTGIALIGFGILIAKIRFAFVELSAAAVAQPPPNAPPIAGGRSALLGAAFALLGILVMALGAGRYAAGERAIEQGTFQPRGGQLLALAFLLILLGIAVLLYLSDLWQV